MATKLKKRVKKKWVEALRSGKYQQGRNYLATGDRYCCLGVLCEVAIESGFPVEKKVAASTYYDGTSTFLPATVYDWATLKKGRDDRSLHVSRGSLVSLNDEVRLSFTEIADLIEKEL